MNPVLQTARRALLNRFRPLYEGKRIVVTGADGFIGSHLCETLLDCGARVTAFCRASGRRGFGEWVFRCIERDPRAFEAVVAGDIADPDAISILAATPGEIVFHLAAIAYVNYSFDHPAEVFRVNAVGTLNALEAARRIPSLRRFVLTSSSEVYGAGNGDPIREDHPLRPTSPYAASKAAADRLGHSYAVTFGTPVVIVRPFNTYGPRHTYDVIPKFIRLALGGEPLTVYGDGMQRRDFLYVLDTVQGFLLAGSAAGIEGETVHFGSGEAPTIRSIAETILLLSGSRSEIVHVPRRAAEVDCLLADASRARTHLGFQPCIPLEAGLRENIDWERKRIENILSNP